ncbi:hypothetical protein DM860_018004 [Cuscuta australis]|uniref:DUF4283 domain-containing protein n=1 Tax=Cuscuta australis TaxID=267555 RepID=A0A328D137_9ASTE|nr:hypothetical protein DM860_018004 [Cuscuta australis]
MLERENITDSTAGILGRKKLFSEVLKSLKDEEKLQGTNQGTFKGCPSISFTQEDIQKLSKRFAYALIGSFSRRPPFPVLKTFLQKLGLRGDLSLGTLSSNQVLINFQFEEDYQRVFLRQTWTVGNHLMVITKWTTDHIEGFDCPIVPVWVSCPKLPVFLHDQRALSLIASTIGRPLKVDENTLNFSRPDLARFCVEVDVSKPLPPKVHIKLGEKDLFLHLIFENVPHYCSSCLKLGHSKGHCILPGKESHQEDQPRTSKGKDTIQETWTMVTSKKSRPGTVWKRKLGPPLSGPGECSKSQDNQQQKDTDPAPIKVPVPAPDPIPVPEPALVQVPCPDSVNESARVTNITEDKNLALVLWNPLPPILESKFTPLLSDPESEDSSSEASDYDDLGIVTCHEKTASDFLGFPPLPAIENEKLFNSTIKSRLRSANKSFNPNVSQ